MNQRTSLLSRMFLVFGLVLLLPVAIAFQLLRIQFLEGSDLRQLWSQQTVDYISIPAERGQILDENGRKLVTNTVAYKVAIDPLLGGSTQKNIDKLCATLAGHTSRSEAHYKQKIRSAPKGSRYVVLEKKVQSPVYDALKELEIPNLILEEQYRRSYNYGQLGAHALGYVNHELNGMTGLESFYDDQLRGEDGIQQVRRDRHNRIYAYIGAPTQEPREGYDLHTTLDVPIQAIVEDELEWGVDYMKAEKGVAIVIDPRTGAIKAMANYPTYNPNQPGNEDDHNRRNFAIADMIEPGSTFKLVTAIAAVEQGAVSMREEFETPEDGRKRIHGQMMRDHDPLGTLTFPEVIQKSSNIATSQIAMRLKPRIFYQYARNLGFGTPTNVDLPHESAGRLRKPFEWSKVTLPWISIGYEVQVTPLQLAQAYAAFANEGKMMRPYLVKKVTDKNGKTVNEQEPIAVRDIAQRSTLNTLLPIFEDVVSDSGTAEWAQIEGLSIAGKTGTAQKYIDGNYRMSYRASFVGFFPSRSPRYVCLVLLDEPKRSFYGGYAAGTIFRKITNRIAALDHQIERKLADAKSKDTAQKEYKIARMPNVKGLTVNQARNLLKPFDLDLEVEGDGKMVMQQSPAADSLVKATGSIVLKTEVSKEKESPSKFLTVPEVTGLPMRNAVNLLVEAGFEIKLIGSGDIIQQYPKPGASMRKGSKITIRGSESSLETLTRVQTRR